MSRRYADRQDVERVERAVRLLREVRDLLAAADCPNTLRCVRLCLTSAGGALRNVRHREMHSREIAKWKNAKFSGSFNRLATGVFGPDSPRPGGGLTIRDQR